MNNEEFGQVSDRMATKERELYVLVPPYRADQPSLINRVAAVLLAHRWIVTACAIAGLALGLARYFLAQPIYVASATLAAVPVDEAGGALAGLENQVGGLAALAGISVGDGSLAKDEAIAILKSKALTYPFLRDNNLLPVLFKDKWDAETKKWAVDAKDVPTISDAWQVFDEQIRAVREDRRTGLITLSVEWSDREAAARWVTELISRLNNLMRSRDIDEAERNILYLNRELDRAQSVELRQTIYRVMETQIKKIMLANIRSEYAMRVIDPPLVPDVDDFVSPRLFASVIVGGLVGSFVGAFMAFWLASRAGRMATGNRSVQSSASGGSTGAR